MRRLRSRPFDQPWWRRLWGLGAAQPDLELRERFCEQGGHVLARTPLLDVSQHCRSIHAELLRNPCRDRLERAGLALVVLVLMAVILTGLIDCFFSSPSQRGWVLLGLTYHIGSRWNIAWQKLLVVARRIRYVRVVVKRRNAQTLFEAITTRLE